MGKALIKSINNSMGSAATLSISVSSTGATGNTQQGSTNPPGQVLTGTLQDIQSNALINFSIAFGAELGIQVGSKVNYTTVTVGGQVIANVAKLTHKGEIKSVNATDDGGILTDMANGQPIAFAQTGANESGFASGTKVNFERVVNPMTGNIVAVALELVADN